MNKIDDQMCEWAELYALGGLNAEEKKQFESHLAVCASCRQQVSEMIDIVGKLPLAVTDAEPPEGMKSRVLGAILGHDLLTTGEKNEQGTLDLQSNAEAFDLRQQGNKVSLKRIHDSGSLNIPADSPAQDPRRVPNSWQICSAALVAVVIGLVIYSIQMNGKVNGLEYKLAESAQAVEGMKQQLTALKSPVQGVKVNEAVKLSPAAEGIVAQGLATIVIDDKGTHLMVQAENLPKLSGNEAFQVWLIKGDVKQNAGTFLSNQGTGAVYYTFEPDAYDMVAITLEPDANGEQPRGEVILAAKIKS